MNAPAIAEVDIVTGDAMAIAWEPFLTFTAQKTGVRSEVIASVDWDADRQILTLEKRLPDGVAAADTYKRSGRSWTKVEARIQSEKRPVIEWRESSNSRPKLYATGGACQCTRVLFDPAPQADDLSFGRQELLQWVDPHGHQWEGGLIYPVGYEPGKRYPFVLQTHGYSREEFVIDGPAGVTSAFAAQPFANAGFVVLQARESGSDITIDEHEGKNVADGWKAVIDQLNARGLIDPAKVGIIGWSRTGYHVAAMMAEYPHSMAAATISDAVQYNYTQYLVAGDSANVQEEFGKVTGGLPAAVGYGTWFERNSIYRMNGSKAALRIEAIGPESLLAMWETYALYRRADKPADLVYFPEGSHVLLKPSERLGSQGGNVDWFRFWLQGYEDPALGKKEQYLRWRKLRVP